MASRKINPELVLISNVVDQNDWTAIKKKNVSADYFLTEEGREAFEWLRLEMARPENKGVVPSRDRLVRRFQDFQWCPDGRDTIDALIVEIQQRYTKSELRIIADDLVDILGEEGHDPKWILERILASTRDLMVANQDEDGMVLANSFDIIEARYKAKKEAGGLTGIPYPWENLNRASGGMQPEQFLVLYGRPKNFKTWLGTEICAHAYDANQRVLVYSKEMSKIQMMERTACCLFDIDYGPFLQGDMTDEQEYALFEGLKYLKELEEETRSGVRQRSLFFISDQGMREGATVDALEARVDQFEPDLILCDGFYHMSDGKKASKDWERVMAVSRGLKSMAQRMKIPILGTTQANREAVKGAGDETSELAFADAIAQEADLVMRCFKGRSPTGDPAILMRMVAAREMDLAPFLINARPGKDFSLMQERGVDIGQFLKDKKYMDQAEEEAENSGGSRNAPSSQKKKPGKPGHKFRI